MIETISLPETTWDLRTLAFVARRSERTLYRDMKAGRLRPTRCGVKLLRFTREEVRRFLTGDVAAEVAGLELASV
jgi:hypothetical protein